MCTRYIALISEHGRATYALRVIVPFEAPHMAEVNVFYLIIISLVFS